MNCSEFRAALGGWFRAELPEDERRRFERHRDACAACRAELEAHSELSCRECVEFLATYLDGELEERRRAVFERHVSHCPPCLHYLESYRQTVELARRCGGEEPVHQPLPEELVRAILAACRRPD